MICFETHITGAALEFFQRNIQSLADFTEINALLKNVSGINNFFTSQKQTEELLEALKTQSSMVSEPTRREYGDFQTNPELALRVTKYVLSKSENIEFVLEPTCGRGNFILATIQQATSLKKIVGVEIYQPYVWETKFKILTYFLTHECLTRPEIDILHDDAFDFPYNKLAQSTTHLKTLVIGNPPWVTNSELSTLASHNLPQKSNFKKHSGLEAITGKGNFDIGEYISLIMLQCFENHNGIFAFLIKNSVVKNLIQEQRRNSYRIGLAEKLCINSKKEFDVSVQACLFVAHLNSEPEVICNEFDFYSQEYTTTFGWYKDKFVHSTEDYDVSSIVEGQSIFTWRSGVKHDCAKVMELEQVNGHFVNGFGEKIHLEKNLLYGLLKSSDLKNNITSKCRKLVIITQHTVGQETAYIKNKFPLTHQYLHAHKALLEKRKSSIYKGKPSFSIFGIGDYSFSHYKVAISGLYKSTRFTLVNPNDEKPIMLDDTCYFIGFDQLQMAQVAHYVVNSELVQKFLQSIIFSDAKRAINKDVLMRIDFEKAFEHCSFANAQERINGLSIEHWENFRTLIARSTNKQIALL